MAQKLAPRRRREQQHRQLQPHLTRAQRRRSGDGVRSRRRDELVPRGGGDGRHPPLGIERARDAPDLLPPRAQGGAARGAALRRSIRGAPPRRPGPTAGSRSTWAADIALANGVARVILERGLEDRAFIDRATTGFDAYRGARSRRTRSSACERDTGVPAALVERMALDYARADRAMICWTLGITEHHNAVDNVLGLINLCAPHRARGPLGIGAQPAARPEQRAGRRRHGRAAEQAHRLPGRRGRRGPRPRFERAWGVTIPPKNGWNLTQMFEAMGRGELTALYVIGENPAQSEADGQHTLARAPRGSSASWCRTSSARRPPSWPTWSSPRSASFCESEGTVTNSERRVQRVRRSLAAAGPAPATTSPSSATSPAASVRTWATLRPPRSGTSCAPSAPCTRG